MSDKQEKPSRSDESMKPVRQNERTTTPVKFALAMASDMIALFAFMTGAGAIAAGLNVIQALIACGIALCVGAGMMILNGMPGFKLGIPMLVQMRPCFGEKFAFFAASLRAIPAIAWTGYNSFLGAVGLNLFSILLFGYNNVWVWFFVFHFAQVVLSADGVKKMLNFSSYAALALFAIILVMIAYIFNMFGGEKIATDMFTKPGGWRPFLFTVTANVSLCITVVVNSSDYIRHVPNDSIPKYAASYALGAIPTLLVMAGFGMVVASMTGIWSPIDLFVKYVPNILIVAIAMCFIILGQFSTNMFANIIPANIIWCSAFKFPWWFSSVFTGCLSLFIIPWFLTSTNGFYVFMNVYGAMLGPVGGIMLTDFFLIRKRKYNIRALYEKNSQYTYAKGVNFAGVIALAAGSAVAFWQMDFSAVIGTITSAIVYYFCYTYITAPKYPQVELKSGYTMESPDVIHEIKDTYYI
jgi:NCS1 family nucleobase:cation symporter-1